MASEEELFSRAVPVKLKSQDREERFGCPKVVKLLCAVPPPLLG